MGALDCLRDSWADDASLALCLAESLLVPAGKATILLLSVKHPSII